MEQAGKKKEAASSLYMGRPVESLTREELIEALERVGRLHQQTLDNHDRSARFLADLEKARPRCFLCGRK